jgi:hypothetical protein
MPHGSTVGTKEGRTAERWSGGGAVDAVREILESLGVGGALRFAEAVRHPHPVGHAVGASDVDEELAPSLPGRTLGASSPKRREPGRALVDRLARGGEGGQVAPLPKVATRLGWDDRQEADLVLGPPPGGGSGTRPPSWERASRPRTGPRPTSTSTVAASTATRRPARSAGCLAERGSAAGADLRAWEVETAAFRPGPLP